MGISPPTAKLLAFSMLDGMKSSILRELTGIDGFEGASPEQLSARIPALARMLESSAAWRDATEAAQRQCEEARRHHAAILSPMDRGYPELLAATSDHPALLHVQGSLARPLARSLAVIGSREPTPDGARTAAGIATFFAERGWSIVSGLAIGCDAIAHRAALDAGAHTLAVLGHGLHTLAPARHRELADRILDAGGALISEYRFGEDARPARFRRRNRIQAGIAQAVVMVQSDLQGGSLHAPRAALDYRRRVIVPCPTEQDRRNAEPKAQANLLLADGTVAQKTALLRCRADALDLVSILRDMDDWRRILARLTSETP